MFLRDLLQGAIGRNVQGGAGVAPNIQGGTQGEGQNPIQYQNDAANALHPAIMPGAGMLRGMMMRNAGRHGVPIRVGQMQPAAPMQGAMPPQEDSYTAADYAQGSPSYNNGQVSLHGSFYNGGGLNGRDINQRPGGTIHF